MKRPETSLFAFSTVEPGEILKSAVINGDDTPSGALPSE